MIHSLPFDDVLHADGIIVALTLPNKWKSTSKVFDAGASLTHMLHTVSSTPL